MLYHMEGMDVGRLSIHTVEKKMNVTALSTEGFLSLMKQQKISFSSVLGVDNTIDGKVAFHVDHLKTGWNERDWNQVLASTVAERLKQLEGKTGRPFRVLGITSFAQDENQTNDMWRWDMGHQLKSSRYLYVTIPGDGNPIWFQIESEKGYTSKL